MSATESKRIDWDDVKRRLLGSQLALEKAGADDPERIEAIHLQRANELAARRTQISAPVAAMRVLVFSLGAERYALEFADLVEILAFAECTAVPAAPPELLGVVNIGGEIRSVLDLGRLLGLPPGAAGAPGYLLRVRHGGRETALRVDSLENSQSFSAAELASLGDGDANELLYVEALAPNKVRLLNLEALLDHPVFQRGSLQEDRSEAKEGQD